MRKALIITILIFLIVIIFKFRFSNYEIKYKVDNYDIKTVYKNKRFYYEISKDDRLFNFDIYAKRKFNYTKIDSIKEISDENLFCIVPKIDDIKTYPLCYLNDEFTDYNIIDSSLLEEYKEIVVDVDKGNKDFIYYGNLNDDEYIALWNYKGYIVMNGKQYKNVDLFKKDKYDNSLAYLLNGSIYMANNDEEHEYTSLIKLDLKSLNSEVIKLDYTIDYDSYIVGSIKNNLYIFDNKYSVLYEINTKNKKTTILSNNEKGYVKYVDGEFVNCSKSEYKVDKIKYNSSNSKYSYSVNNGLYKIISDNKNISQRISNNDLNVLYENNSDMYNLFDDVFYKYDPVNGNNPIFYNYELTFNSDNTVFVYNK